VANLIAAASNARRPFALIRLGDGEALTLAQYSVRPLPYIAGHAFLREAGVIVPDLRARERVLAAVRHADVVGVAVRRDLPDFAPLTEEAFTHFSLHPARLCDCCINYALQAEEMLVPLLRGRRLFLINRCWLDWAEALARLYGLKVIGGATVDHFGQAETALSVARHRRFDIALVAAGVPATWLAVCLAHQNRCVALDIGRLADLMIALVPGGRQTPKPISTSRR